MKRFLPSGLNGRITLILTVGLLSAQAIAFWLFLHDRIVTSLRVFGFSFADQVVTIVDLLEATPSAEQSKLLQALNSPLLQVSISEVPLTPPEQEAWHGEEIRQAVRSRLLPQLHRPIEVQLLDRWSESPPSTEPYMLIPSRQKMVIAISQSDDHWWVFVAPVDIASLRQSWHIWVWLVVLGIAIWLISIWAARRVTRPVTRFAIAAERFGRDINAPPLAETGSRELRQSIQAFNQMQSQLRELVNSRTFMLAAISHDLRTVLTRLKLRIEFIEDDRQAGKAIADINQMQAMLAETMALAREESAAERFIKVDLAELLQSSCDNFIDHGKQVTYTGPAKLPYVGQPTALRRAFTNLISNAVTYGNEAEISLMSGKRFVEVSISDRGPGIPADLREKVFAPFFRLERSRNRETGGTGLGLAVVKIVIHRHGGKISLKRSARRRPAGSSHSTGFTIRRVTFARKLPGNSSLSHRINSCIIEQLYN